MVHCATGLEHERNDDFGVGVDVRPVLVDFFQHFYVGCVEWLARSGEINFVVASVRSYADVALQDLGVG